MPKSNVPRPPAMTITIDVDGGPTVRLGYDGRGSRGTLVQHTRITVGEQPTPFGPDDLKDLLVDACAVLAGYVFEHNDWPADLRPAPQSPPTPEEQEEEVYHAH